MNKPDKKRKNTHMRAYATIILIIIVIAIIAYAYAAHGQKLIYLNSSLNESITYSPLIFSMNGNEYAVYLTGTQKSNAAHIDIAQMPAMIEPLLYVNLTLHNTTKVNIGSNYATLEIKLNSVTNNSIGVTMIPVSASLNIAPDKNMIKVINVAIQNSNSTGIKIYTNISNMSKTTTTTTTASTASTTSIKVNVTNETQAKITSLLNSDKFYPLMVNFTALYRNTSACTPQLYNSTYSNYYKETPIPTYSYQNVSQATPYNLIMKTVGQKNLYIVSYIALTKGAQFNGTTALSIAMNLSSDTLINSTLNVNGIYSGLNYTVLKELYTNAAKVGAPCGIYIAH